jgi:hypothetical protein
MQPYGIELWRNRYSRQIDDRDNCPGPRRQRRSPGIAIWVDGDQPAANDTFDGGSSQNIDGAIYLPRRQVNYSGDSSAVTRCSQLIAERSPSPEVPISGMIAGASGSRTQTRFSTHRHKMENRLASRDN